MGGAGYRGSLSLRTEQPAAPRVRLYGGEFVGMARELLVWHHVTTGDPKTLKILRQTTDLMVAHAHLGPLTAFTMTSPMHFAYLARLTGDNSYIAPVMKDVGQWGIGWEEYSGNRAFMRAQFWSVPFVSMLEPGRLSRVRRRAR